jgi:N-acyl-D-aspartate/D-glutamate deacylase
MSRANRHFLFGTHSRSEGKPISKEDIMAQFDTIIKGGTVVDGTRVPRYKADIGIKNGKIAQIGRLSASDATKVLDATGLIVAPGFIDLHTHYDAQLHWDPYCSIGGWHGVTS